jgi:hypothetical protein
VTLDNVDARLLNYVGMMAPQRADVPISLASHSVATVASASVSGMGTCELCGEQIVWDDGDWITLDGRGCPRAGEHRLARPQASTSD